MWEKLGIEPEDYNLAIDQYELLEDEYVIKRQEEVDMRVSEDLRNGLIEPFFVNPQEDFPNCSQHMSDDEDVEQMRFGDYNNDGDLDATGQADVFYMGQNDGYQSDDDYDQEYIQQQQQQNDPM